WGSRAWGGGRSKRGSRRGWRASLWIIGVAWGERGAGHPRSPSVQSRGAARVDSRAACATSQAALGGVRRSVFQRHTSVPDRKSAEEVRELSPPLARRDDE